MIDSEINNLRNALHQLSGLRLLPTALDKFKRHKAKINRELLQRITDEIPAFATSRNPDIYPQLKKHLHKNTQTITNLFNPDFNVDFDFVRHYNRRRAQQHFPLETNLHAYRICHKVYTRRLRQTILKANDDRQTLGEAITLIDDFVLEYTDTISTLAAEAYIEQTRIMTEAAGDMRAELLSILLEGFDESDGRVSKILRESGYLDKGQLFCVALAQSVEPTEMLNHERARRMADSIEKLFQSRHGKRLIDVRDNKVVAVFSDVKRISGWARPHQGLAEHISTELALVGNAALIGISKDVQSTSQIPGAYQQALMALKLARPSKRVICASQLSTLELLLHLSGEELNHALPQWATDFYRADEKSNGSLSATLQAYAKTNMNILKAAAVLSIHPNTVYTRFKKIEQLTGLDARRFHGLCELLLVCDIRATTGWNN